MNAVWRCPDPVSVRHIHAGLEEVTGWAHSTVKTLMARLADKGALSVDRSAKQSLFRPAVEQSSPVFRKL